MISVIPFFNHFNHEYKIYNICYSFVYPLPQSGRMAIHWASSGGHSDVVEYLLSRGVPINSRDEVTNQL